VCPHNKAHRYDFEDHLHCINNQENEIDSITVFCDAIDLFINSQEEAIYNDDNVLISIVNIFQIITLEGWTEMMYIVRESEGTIAYDFLFVACVLFGAFFVLNLMIAVQFTYLGAAFDEEDRRQKEIKDKMSLKKRLKQ
jgi:uncharacterized membrane protein YhdT